jgi:uncharacterized protein YukE
MTMYKLSPEQARDLAGKFNAAEGDTAGLIKSMNADVHLMHSMITTLNSGVKSLDAAGHRAMRFDNQWDNEFRPAMQRVAEAISEFTPVLGRMKQGLREAEHEMHQRAAATEEIDRV